MVKLDEQESKIVKELIKNPRISDNKISKNTRVPVMTVNRKRKKLEEKGVLKYYTAVDRSRSGTGTLPSKELYIIKFKIGLTQKKFLQKIESSSRINSFFAQHVDHSFLGEKDGHLALIIVLNEKDESDLMEVFNGEVIPFLKDMFGDYCIEEVTTSHISKPIRLHHNYLPSTNVENGRIKPSWSEEWIFVDVKEGDKQKDLPHFEEKFKKTARKQGE